MKNLKLPKKLILVTGASGMIGPRVVDAVLKMGYLVRTLSLEPLPDNALFKEVDEHIGDINNNDSVNAAIRDVSIVVHLAARVHLMRDKVTDPLAEFRKVNVEGTRNLAEAAFNAGVQRLIFMSSVKVNGESTDDRKKPFSERDNPAPEDDYALSKWEAEQVLQAIGLQTGLEIVTIRSPLIYGPGVKANFLRLLKFVDLGIPLPLGGISNKRSLLGLTNLVDIICLCLAHPAAAGETFLVCDNQDVSTPELLRLIAEALGKKAHLVPIPEGIINLVGRITGQTKNINRLCRSLQIDSSKTRSLLGGKPPCKIVDELSATAVWYLKEAFHRSK